MIEDYCQQLSVGDACQLWHDSDYPTRALCHRPSPLMPLVLLLAGGSWLIKLHLSDGLPPWALATSIGIWIVMHALFVAVARYFVEVVDTVRLARRCVEVCPHPEQVNVDRTFFAEAEAELSHLGLARKHYLYAPLIRKVRHINLDAVFVSDDLRTMVIVGEVRFVGRLLGLLPLPFDKLQGIYFHSLMSNGVLIETLRGSPQPDPPGKVHQYLPHGTSVSQLQQSHEQFVREYEQSEQTEPLPFATVTDCIRSYLHDLHSADLSLASYCELESA